MPLQSKLLSGVNELENCLVRDSAHIVPGSKGDHVRRIQIALIKLSDPPNKETFEPTGFYGPQTAAAVKRYKNAPQRQILQSWQTTADDIVGKRTIQSLDDEMTILENMVPFEARSFVPLMLASPGQITSTANVRDTRAEAKVIRAQISRSYLILGPRKIHNAAVV